jgi:exodeoxyribonuclease VII large subunit
VRAQRVDELVGRARRGLMRRREQGRDALRRLRERLDAFRWDRQLQARRERTLRRTDRLRELVRSGLEARRARLGRRAAQLDGMSPLAVLGRGYALVWDERGAALLRDAAGTEEGAHLLIRLHRGALRAIVESKEPL